MKPTKANGQLRQMKLKSICFEKCPHFWHIVRTHNTYESDLLLNVLNFSLDTRVRSKHATRRKSDCVRGKESLVSIDNTATTSIVVCRFEL